MEKSGSTPYKSALGQLKPVTRRLPRFSLALMLILPLLSIMLTTVPALAQDEQATKPTILSSEAPSLRFEHLEVANGLAQSSGNTIVQDSRGFLWIATQGGLHRYDGHEFKVYKAIPFDTTSLSKSWVWAATEAKNGDLWVTTEGGGLNRLNPATGRAKHYRHNPKDSTSISSDRTFYALEASNGDLWVSTFDNGLNRMRDGQDGQFTHYRHNPDDPNSLSSNTLFWMNEDAEGKIWAGSTNGINRIDPQTNTIKRFLYDPDHSPGYGAPQNVLGQYIPPNEANTIWLATGNGLVRLNSKTGKYQRYLIAPNKGRINPLNFIHQVMPDPVDPEVLWVGGPGTGIARFDMRTKKFTSYRHDPRDPHSLSENYVQSLFTDRSGTMWVGTASGGIDAFNPGAVNFMHLRNDPENSKSLAPGIVWGIYEDHYGSLWVGTDVGSGGNYLTQFNAAGGSVKRYRYDPNNPATLQGGNLRSFAEDRNGQFWVAGNGGLSRLNRKTGRVKRFPHPRDTQEGRRRNNIFALLPATGDANVLWVGSVGGLDRFDTRSGRYTPVPLDTNGVNENPVILSLYEDIKGILWAGSSEGLLRVDPSGNVTLASSYDPQDTTTISQNQIFSITERAEEPGILWLATSNGGLNRFDTQTGIATHYTTANGLPSNTVYAVLTDNSGTLWMSTNSGISNLDPKTDTFRNYGLDDGLMALEYNQNAYAKGSNGVLYFGSGDGVTSFVPEQLHINEIPPQVALTGFRISNKPVAVGPDSPLKQPLDETKSITLRDSQNDFSFEFVALHFANPAKNTYAYKLEGFDEDWVKAGTQHSATYTNLPPGDYTFRVKAANADGVWNEQGASVKLTVLPPWWRTWWGYGLFAFLLGSIVFGVDRTQRWRLSKKEQERAMLREAELRAEAENKRRADTEQLSQIGRAITSTLSVHKIIDTVYESVNALMDAAIFGVGIYNEEHHCLDFPATKEKGEMLPPYTHQLNEEDRLAVWCFKNRKEIIIGDYAREYKQYINVYKPPVEGEDSASVIYMPLVQQDRVIGVITTQSFQKDAYTPYHLNLLRNLATYAAIALDNAAAYRRLNATLSELKTMQQQLVQQEKLASLGQLTAGIAHEIKNPLNFVNNFSDVSIELIEEVRQELSVLSQPADTGTNKPGSAGVPNGTEAGDVSVPEASGYSKASPAGASLSPIPASGTVRALLDDIETNLHKIHEHGARADSIVKSMLQHSRGGTGSKEPTDINMLMREYVNLAFHGMRAGKNPINVDIELDLDETAREVPLVAEDFSRVILNLCANAFDAMREKLTDKPSSQEGYEPKLTVRTQQNTQNLSIEIKDNGPGIPEKIRQKIFEPFFTTKPAGKGTGLGLSMTYDIISYHNSTLQVFTEAGQFTKFIITIPT